MSRAVEVSDPSFDAFVKENKVAVVDCWAPWCGPCKRIAPIIDELSEEMAGTVTFGKLNTDDNPNSAAKHGVMSIPTLLVFVGGRKVDQVIGFMPKDDLKNRIIKSIG